MNDKRARDSATGGEKTDAADAGVTEEAPGQETETAPPRPEEMPGRRLREARERQSLGVDEAAGRLHLQPAQVRALEQDDYRHFSAPIFVSGYLRNYAKMLGLDPGPLVDAYERQGVEEPPILSELTAKMPPATRRSMSTEVWGGLLVGGALVVLVVLWFLTRPPGDMGDGVPRPAAGPPPSSSPDSGAPTEVPAPPLGETVPVPGGEGQASTSPLRPPAVQDPEAPLDELVLRFTEDSWVEIADVTGRRLMYRMGRAGQEVTLRGLAPFDILLGNAPGVAIEYNGEPYQDIPISRQNVASFRLGGNN